MNTSQRGFSSIEFINIYNLIIHYLVTQSLTWWRIIHSRTEYSVVFSPTNPPNNQPRTHLFIDRLMLFYTLYYYVACCVK